jgi:hypothetical protein
MENTTILFIHKGDSWYLSYALKQAKKSNPHANIILLGDDSNTKYSNIVKHFYITEYFEAAQQLALIYKHFSTTGYDHELFCIQRWFIMLELANALNIDHIMLVDTDVLLFQDINIFLNNIKVDYEFSQGITNPMGFVFFKSRENLKKMCDYIFDFYSTSDGIEVLTQMFSNWKIENAVGGVSDITFFYLYKIKYPNCYMNFELPPIEGNAFCFSLESSYYIRNRDGYIVIKWIDNIPYATLLTGEKVSVMGIHCFGLQKRYIRKLYQGPGKIQSRIIYCWKESKLKLFADKIRGRK